MEERYDSIGLGSEKWKEGHIPFALSLSKWNGMRRLEVNVAGAGFKPARPSQAAITPPCPVGFLVQPRDDFL